MVAYANPKQRKKEGNERLRGERDQFTAIEMKAFSSMFCFRQDGHFRVIPCVFLVR